MDKAQKRGAAFSAIIGAAVVAACLLHPGRANAAQVGELVLPARVIQSPQSTVVDLSQFGAGATVICMGNDRGDFVRGEGTTNPWSAGVVVLPGAVRSVACRRVR